MKQMLSNKIADLLVDGWDVVFRLGVRYGVFKQPVYRATSRVKENCVNILEG